MRTMLAPLLILLASVPNASAAERPNILFCFADDWGRYAGAYTGEKDQSPNSVVKTPHFDRVAREGVLFTHAFVNAPSCTPCRSALLSGQYFYRTGRAAILQGAVWNPEIPSYPLLLEQAGYHIGFTYKVWSPGTPRDAPYGEKKHAYHQAGRRFNSFSQQVSKADDIQAAKQSLYDEVRGNFRAFLKDRKAGQPFCYWFGPTNCHRKWVKGSGKKLWGIDPDRLEGKLPPFLPDNEVVRQDFADYLGEAQAFDAGVGVLLAELERIGEADNTIVVISGDHGAPGFPNGKCNLYDFGVHVALAVRWPQQVPGNRTVHDFVNLMDLAPTFLAAAGEKPPRLMTGRSLLDLLKTEKSGQLDPSRDFVVVGRERHVAKARPGQLPYPQRAIRTEDYLYIRNFQPDRWPMGSGPGYGEPQAEMPPFERLEQSTFVAFADLDASPTKAWIVTHRKDPGMEKYFQFAVGRRPAEELFDLRKDPHQVNNVAGQADYEQVRKRLSARLMQVLKETGDPRVTGEGDTFEKPPFAGGTAK